jgi:hypothetical protein
MSEEFKIQKDPKRTIDITPDDMDDIDLDELKDINFDDELNLDNSSHGSLVFTKEKMSVPNGNANSFFDFTRPSNKSANNKKEKPATPKVNVKKDQAKVSAPPRVVPKKPVVEPDSMDFGLDMIANKQKKNVPKEESEDSASESRSESSRSSRASKRSLDLDFNELDKVKDIMDGASESSGGSLSERIRDRVRSKGGSGANANENERKQELLFLFDKLEKKGIKIPQKFTMRSSVEDMEKTYERLKNERDLQNSIKFQRRVLMGVVSTMEFVNHSVNPFDIDLDGWSESVMENYSEYDDIFEELYEKYKNKGHISPEVKLLMTLAGSAFYFHLSKMIIKPAQQKMQEMFGAMDGAAAGGGGGMPDLGSMGGLMSGLMGGFMGGGGPKGGNQKPATGGGMKGPQGFDDILSKDSGSDIPSIASIPKDKGRNSGMKRTFKM